MELNQIVRKAELQDIDTIMRFIKENWSDTHILANQREFFIYEFQYKEAINFIISESILDHKILGILGYIVYGHEKSDIMTVMWMSVDKKNPFLGVALLQFLLEDDKHRIVASCGINERALAIYRYLGFYTGRLEHYYRLGENTEYKILKQINYMKNKINYSDKDTGYSLQLIKTFQQMEDNFDFEFFKQQQIIPYKEPWYINKRYFNHPVYEYKVYAINTGEKKYRSALIMREQNHMNTKIIRIIDFLGDPEELRFLLYEIDRILNEGPYMYIDFYQHGISREIMYDAGFSLKNNTDMILPNYFEPFINENININYATTNDNDFYIFKGDGDQDRPNYYVCKEHKRLIK